MNCKCLITLILFKYVVFIFKCLLLFILIIFVFFGQQTNTSQLEKMIKNEPINLDSIEQRLLSLRERMSTMEENKILIDHGYKPYKPVDVSTIDDVEMITETQLEDVPDPSFLITPVRSTSKKINLESIETLKPNEIEVMPVSKEITSYNGQSKTPLNLKNCTSSFVRGFLNLQKYNRRESSEPFTFEFLMKEKLNIESLMGKNLNLEKPSNFSSTPITPTLPTSMIRNHTFTINKDYFKSDDILKQHQEQENNYETFEFTPGMKSKVIRK